jgi:hypothetical protein
MIRDIATDEIDKIMLNQTPYELAFSGVHLPQWDPDKEMFMILALKDQFTNTNISK